MSFTITKLDTRISSSNIKTGVSVTNGYKSCKLTITAQSGTKYNWRLEYTDFDGSHYVKMEQIVLPQLSRGLGQAIDLENPMEMSELAHYIKTEGREYDS